MTGVVSVMVSSGGTAPSGVTVVPATAVGFGPGSTIFTNEVEVVVAGGPYVYDWSYASGSVRPYTVGFGATQQWACDFVATTDVESCVWRVGVLSGGVEIGFALVPVEISREV